MTEAAAPLSATYTLSAGDIGRAAAALSRHSIATNALGFALLLSGAFSLLANGDPTGVAVGGVGLVFLSGQAMGLVSRLMAGRRPDLLREPVVLTATAESIRTEMASMRGEAAWTSYRRVRSAGGALVLEVGTGPAVVVPERAFDAASLDRMRGWAARAGILDASSPLRAYVLGFVGGLGFNLAIFAVVVVATNL